LALSGFKDIHVIDMGMPQRLFFEYVTYLEQILSMFPTSTASSFSAAVTLGNLKLRSQLDLLRRGSKVFQSHPTTARFRIRMRSFTCNSA